MLDQENELIGWFDSTIQAHALGVPERDLDELMYKSEGSFAIIERGYASTGRVKVVIIKNFGPDHSGCSLEFLRDFASSFGLDFIWRPRLGIDICFNGGRYFSPEHDSTLLAS